MIRLRLKQYILVAGIMTLACVVSVMAYSSANAQSQAVPAPISDVQIKINQRTQDIKKLETEIADYLKQIGDLSTQATSLSSTIKSLQLSQKKLEADIKITENRIAEKNLQIKQLGSQISDKEETIGDSRRIIARSFATLNELGDKSIPELLLAKDSLSQAWNSLEDITTIQQGLMDHITNLETSKARLEVNKKETEKAKTELLSLGRQLNDQKKVILENTRENNALLSETKNNQANYTQLLTVRQQQKDAFEREISDLEAALKYSVNPDSIPNAAKGVLGYPLDVVRITQYFGNTTFATKNPQIYNGQGHNGVDFAASVGTPIKSAADGVVVGFGNTDTACPGASYGKWILVRHANGLTTVYGHLSYVSASTGQAVKRGETIAYSGYSGNVVPRGPRGAHLHFTVFASDGVTVGTYNFKSCTGAKVKMPLLTKKDSYLNPLSYF